MCLTRLKKILGTDRIHRSVSHENILVLWKHPAVPNPKPLVAKRGCRNYSTHSQQSCHQEPGATGPVCSAHHTGLVLKASLWHMTPRVCNCGSAFFCFLSLVCFAFFLLLKVRWSLVYLRHILTHSFSPFTPYLIILFPSSSTLITLSFFSLILLCESVCMCVCAWPYSQEKREPILAKINSPRSHFTTRALMSPVNASWKMMCVARLSS